jgi:Fungal Zn(2)-Cys(6) binuclear cluster domain
MPKRKRDTSAYPQLQADGSSVANIPNRVQKACDACHRSKSKCINSGAIYGEPCVGCTKRGIPCTYSESKKRGPKSGLVREIQAEMELLKAQLASVSSGSFDDRSISQHKLTSSSSSSEGRSMHPSLVKADSESTSSSLESAITMPMGVSSLLPPSHVSSGFIPIQGESRIASIEREAGFLAHFFTFSNSVLPLVCPVSFYYALLRLSLPAIVTTLYSSKKPHCEHTAGSNSCSKLAFVSLSLKSSSKHDASLIEDNFFDSADAFSLLPRDEMNSVFQSHVSKMSPEFSLTSLGSSSAFLSQHQHPQSRSKKAMTEIHLAASKSLYYGVLAVGARMCREPGLGDCYMVRCRSSLSACWEEPCVETIQALLVAGYYALGVCVSGNMMLPKCYISLANEMIDGMEIAASALNEGKALEVGGKKDEHDHSGYQIRRHSVDNSRSSSNFSFPTEVFISARILSQINSPYRLNPLDAFKMSIDNYENIYEHDLWISPRGHIYKTLARITSITRKSISNLEEFKLLVPSLHSDLDTLLAWLNDDQRYRNLGGKMHFAIRASIYLSKSIIFHASGDEEKSLAHLSLAMREMSNENVQHCNFMTISMMMQALPVCIALKQTNFVNEIQSLVDSFSTVWPVGHLLVDKIVRRVSLHASQSTGSVVDADPVVPSLPTTLSALPVESSKSFDELDLMRRSSIFKSQTSIQQSFNFDHPFSLNSFSNPLGASISSLPGLSMNLVNAPAFQEIDSAAPVEEIKPAKAPMLGALKPRLGHSNDSEGSLQVELQEANANTASDVTAFFAKGGSLGEAAQQAATEGGGEIVDSTKHLTPIIVEDTDRQVSKTSVSSPLEELAHIVSNSPYISHGYAKGEFKMQTQNSLGLLPIHAPSVPIIERADRAEYIYSFPFSNDMYFSPEPLPSPLGTPIGIPHRVLFKA